MNVFCYDKGATIYRDGDRLYQDIGGWMKRVAFRTIDSLGRVFYFTADEPVLLDDGWALPFSPRGEKRYIKDMGGKRTAYVGQSEWRNSKQIVLYDSNR